MKTFLTLVCGAALTIFIFLLYNYINYKNKSSDNNKADEIFSKYIQQGREKLLSFDNEESIVKSYAESIKRAKNIIENAKYSSIDLKAGTREGIVDAINNRVAPFENARTLLFYNDFSPSRIDYIGTAFSAIDNSIYYAYSNLWDFLKNSQIQSNPTIATTINDEGRFLKSKENLTTVLSQQLLFLENKISKLSQEKEVIVNDGLEAGKAKDGMTQNSKDKLLITMVIPIFAVILAIIIIVPYLFRDKSELFNKLLDDKILLQVFTIFILVITILLLGIGSKLNPETLGTLLGGISVYVLQKSMDGRRAD